MKQVGYKRPMIVELLCAVAPAGVAVTYFTVTRKDSSILLQWSSKSKSNNNNNSRWLVPADPVLRCGSLVSFTVDGRTEHFRSEPQLRASKSLV